MKSPHKPDISYPDKGWDIRDLQEIKREREGEGLFLGGIRGLYCISLEKEEGKNAGLFRGA